MNINFCWLTYTRFKSCRIHTQVIFQHWLVFDELFFGHLPFTINLLNYGML